MARFIAVHPVAFTEEQLKPLAKEPLPEGVIWHATFCALADDKSYCHWEAPDRTALMEIFKKYEIPYEELSEVRLFDPVAGLLEAAPKVAQPV